MIGVIVTMTGETGIMTDDHLIGMGTAAAGIAAGVANATANLAAAAVGVQNALTNQA